MWVCLWGCKVRWCQRSCASLVSGATEEGSQEMELEIKKLIRVNLKASGSFYWSGVMKKCFKNWTLYIKWNGRRVLAVCTGFYLIFFINESSVFDAVLLISLHVKHQTCSGEQKSLNFHLNCYSSNEPGATTTTKKKKGNYRGQHRWKGHKTKFPTGGKSLFLINSYHK